MKKKIHFGLQFQREKERERIMAEDIVSELNRTHFTSTWEAQVTQEVGKEYKLSKLSFSIKAPPPKCSITSSSSVT